jgi:hypothetical protein
MFAPTLIWIHRHVFFRSSSAGNSCGLVPGEILARVKRTAIPKHYRPELHYMRGPGHGTQSTQTRSVKYLLY